MKIWVTLPWVGPATVSPLFFWGGEKSMAKNFKEAHVHYPLVSGSPKKTKWWIWVGPLMLHCFLWMQMVEIIRWDNSRFHWHEGLWHSHPLFKLECEPQISCTRDEIPKMKTIFQICSSFFDRILVGIHSSLLAVQVGQDFSILSVKRNFSEKETKRCRRRIIPFSNSVNNCGG